MKVSKEQVLEFLTKFLGNDRVVTDEAILREHDSDNDAFEKAFGVFQTPLPICIANASSTQEISEILKFCNENGVAVIPRTGGSAYERMLSAINEDCIMLDASSMNQILKIDEYNMMATCQCGVPLKTLEDLVNKKGLTTGHCPQSQPLAQMGGLVATKSIGQFSTYYGCIEDLVCGLEAVLADGEVIRIRNVPRRSAGTDLRSLFIGMEGGYAFITEVTVKLFVYPEKFWRGGYIVKDFTSGINIMRNVITKGYRPSVCRLYDKSDYDYNYGNVELNDDEAFMFFVAEGPEELTDVTGNAIGRIVTEAGGREIGPEAVDYWYEHRNDLCNSFKTEELREKFRQTHMYYCTLEIAGSWSDIAIIYERAIQAVKENVEGLVNIGGHMSHSYQNGTNIYFVYSIYIEDHTKFRDVHQQVIDLICTEVLACETGGSAHHHGMGKTRVKFAAQEHGSSYILMRRLKDMMDPNHIMNPGVLVEVGD